MKTIADHISDILENSVQAEASLIEVIIIENKIDDLYTLEIRDNGKGMDKETARKATEPFFTSRKTRKVGLGLPLLKQNAEQTGGKFRLKSEKGCGTTVCAEFILGNIDRPALGDMAGSFLLAAGGHENIAIHYTHSTNEGTFSLHSEELKELLGEVPITASAIRQAIRELINNNLERIKASQ